MTTLNRPLERHLTDRSQIVEAALRAAVDRLSTPLRRVSGYHFGWLDPTGAPTDNARGKALRPALTMAAAKAVGGDPLLAVPAAVAVELIHNFSLLHDDVMDHDRTRRHRPTVWCVFGTAEAILAGDALHALAYEILITSPHPRRRAGLELLSQAVLELVRGQADDLGFERRADVRLEECVRMAGGKTAALLAGATGLGALFGGGSETQVKHLYDFGHDIGLAFQHVDDLLGIWGDPATTGKPTLSDLRNHKKSLPVVAALCTGEAQGELETRYLARQPLSDQEIAQLADLIETKGGRTWSRTEASRLLHSAQEHLAAAIPTPDDRARLLQLAEKLVFRDC